MIEHDDLLDFFKLCDQHVDKIERINYFPLDIIVESPDVSGEELYPLGTDEWTHHVENPNFYQLSNLYLQKNLKSAQALWKDIKDNLSSSVRYNFSINIDFQPDITETELYDWMAGREYNWEDLQLRMRLGSLWFAHVPKRLRNRVRHLGKDLQTHFISGKKTTIAIHTPTYKNEEIEIRYGGDQDSSVICRDEPDDEVVKMIVECFNAARDEESMWGGCLISNMFEVDLEDLSYVIDKSLPLFYNELLDMNPASGQSSVDDEDYEDVDDEDQEEEDQPSLSQFAKRIAVSTNNKSNLNTSKQNETESEEEESTTPKTSPVPQPIPRAIGLASGYSSKPSSTEEKSGPNKHPFFNIPSNRMPIHVITAQRDTTTIPVKPIPVEDVEDEKKPAKRGRKKAEETIPSVKVEEPVITETVTKRTRNTKK